MDEHPNAKVLRELSERLKDGDFQAVFDVLADDVEWYRIPARARHNSSSNASATHCRVCSEVSCA